MKKILRTLLSVALIALLAFSAAACGDKGGENPAPNGYARPEGANIDLEFTASSEILVAYFSKTNTTKGVADKIAELTGADEFEIERKDPYPDAYTPTTEEARDEKEANARPELAVYLPDEVMEQYDTVILGFPIWWHTAPMAVLSFLNYYDMSGKTVYTFCTSGGSSISESTADVRSNANGATVVEGRRFGGGSDGGIESWLGGLGLLATADDGESKPTLPNDPSGDDVDKPSDGQNGEVLVVYFSWSSAGNTKTMAERIARQTGGDIVAIEAAIPYTGSYDEVAYGRAKDEADTNARPEVAQRTYDAVEIDCYESVFVGFPIWWHTAPMIIGTFLEHYVWTAEVRIYPFFQGASNGTQSYYDNSMAFVRGSAAGATVHEGLYASASNTSALDSYLRDNGFAV